MTGLCGVERGANGGRFYRGEVIIGKKLVDNGCIRAHHHNIKDVIPACAGSIAPGAQPLHSGC